MNTIHFLNEVKKKYLLPSDYALAKALGITRGAVSNFQGGDHFLGVETAIKVALLLDLPTAHVVASCQAEKEKNPEIKEMWLEISRRFSPENMTADERIAQAKKRLSA